MVQGVSFALHAGEKLALVGESGSGKSVTALSLLRLLDEAQISGSALLDGRNLLTLSEQRIAQRTRQRCGHDLSRAHDRAQPADAHGPADCRGAATQAGAEPGPSPWAQAIELLAATGIPAARAARQAWPHQLCGRPAPARHAGHGTGQPPQLLLADEPTTALDVALRTQMLELLSDLQRQTGMAVLLITHDLHLVRRFADRVAVMQHGHIVEQAHTAHLFANPQHPYTRQLLDSTPQRHVHPAGRTMRR